MKKINKYIKYVAALALLPVVTACFTGIENTGRITDRDVARVKANKRTAEEALLDSVKPQTYGQWRKGKRFVVTSNDISLVLRPSVDTLKGHTLTFAGQELQRDIDSIEKVVIVLSDTDRQYRYDTGKTLAELQPSAATTQCRFFPTSTMWRALTVCSAAALSICARRHGAAATARLRPVFATFRSRLRA